MTRVDFHFNVPDTIDYACRLIRKIRRAGQQVVVFCDDDARLRQFDAALWTFSALDFIPHLMASDPLAARTPVLLTGAGAATEFAHHDVLINLGDELPPSFTRFTRLVELVGTGAAERTRARERYRHYKDRGYPLESHEVAA